MNYAITGAAGHISKLLAQQLLCAGQNVTVIGRNKDNLQVLKQAGAHTAIGSVEDLEFLKAAFKDVDAVYTMCPPYFGPEGQKGLYTKLGQNYAKAIAANGVRHVVNLSSVGAHLSEGTGPISGLHKAEKALNALHDVNIRHLRPVFFYTNLMANIGMIKNMGIIGANFSIEANRFPVTDPADIAAAAAEELLALNFKGQSVRYIASDETGTDEIARVLGKAIGKPDLKWVQFTEQQALEGMLNAGLPAELANEYVEMYSTLNSGRLTEEYWANRSGNLGAIKLEHFADVFAEAYNMN